MNPELETLITRIRNEVGEKELLAFADFLEQRASTA